MADKFKTKTGSALIFGDVEAISSHGEGETMLHLAGGSTVVVSGTVEEADATLNPPKSAKD